MRYPLVLDLAADGIPVAVTCRVLGFSKQAFYAWKANPISQRDLDDAYLTNAAIDIHHDDPAFGYRFIADELARHGHQAGENRVARLCSAQRIWSVFARRHGLSRRAGPPVHDDLVDRQFTATGPNATWLTDITEHPTGEGKIYLCAIKDVWSNRIVGYSISDRMTAALAVAALRNAIGLRSPAGTVIVHSDRGSQFRAHAYVRTLREHRLTGSMGRVGACGDNAAMESFFACSNATSWTANAGPPATNYASRSSPGSNAPTTAAAANAASANSPRSSLRPSTRRSHSRPEPPNPRVNRTRGSPNRPRKTLGWATPHQSLATLLTPAA
jgi:putative transposase